MTDQGLFESETLNLALNKIIFLEEIILSARVEWRRLRKLEKRLAEVLDAEQIQRDITTYPDTDARVLTVEERLEFFAERNVCDCELERLVREWHEEVDEDNDT